MIASQKIFYFQVFARENMQPTNARVRKPQSFYLKY
jgi:hypothetical protein